MCVVLFVTNFVFLRNRIVVVDISIINLIEDTDRKNYSILTHEFMIIGKLNAHDELNFVMCVSLNVQTIINNDTSTTNIF